MHFYRNSFEIKVFTKSIFKGISYKEIDILEEGYKKGNAKNSGFW